MHLRISQITFPCQGASETFCGIGFSLGPALGGFLYEVNFFKLVILKYTVLKIYTSINLHGCAAIGDPEGNKTEIFKALQRDHLWNLKAGSIDYSCVYEIDLFHKRQWRMVIHQSFK